MYPVHNSSTVRKTRSRRIPHRSKQNQSLLTTTTKTDHRSVSNTSLVINRFHEILRDLKRTGTRFLSYTIDELEPICQQIAIQQMSSTITTSNMCPFLCIFCQNLIYEPLTLYCGHTFCKQCLHNQQIVTSNNCPRCPDDIQGQIQSPIMIAREKSYRKNLFLQDLFEHSEKFKTKYAVLSLCYQGQTEYSNGNYQKAIDIYSQIVDQFDDNHLAFYFRAQAYFSLQKYDESLNDTMHVISLRPLWNKGYLRHSEILFEMKHLAAALMSSLKALAIDPEDAVAKQIMARHLHAVLHSDDDQETLTNMDLELRQFHIATFYHNQITQTNNSGTDNVELTLCNASQSTENCMCSQFDYKNLNLRNFDCSICVNLLWFPITTPCGHVFCRECLIRSVDNTQIQCPICKSSLDEFFPMLIQSHVNQTEIISKIIEKYFPNECKERKQLYEQENLRGALVPNDNTVTTIFEIPIFVCVLAFPNCVCPLHVFEPRYRLMMRRTIETQSRTFGMCTYDEHAGTFADYGTLLYIRGLVYTQDGRSIVDTIGQRRFHVLERGMTDGYNTAKVELIQDHPIEQHEFDDLFQLNRQTYNRVRHWYDNLDSVRKTLINRRLETYPDCDDLNFGSTDGPNWSWIMLSLLPIEELLQYTALASRSFRIRLQMINDAIDFSQNHQQSNQTNSNEHET